MTWLTKLRTHLGHDEPTPVPPDGSSNLEAELFLHKARQAYQEAQGRREEARVITSNLVAINTRNHFGESIELAMMPKEKKP
jgi:hypothetical protein